MGNLLDIITFETTICCCVANTVVKVASVTLLISGLVMFGFGFGFNYKTVSEKRDDWLPLLMVSYFCIISGIFLIWANWHLLKGIRKKKEKHVLKWLVAKGILLFLSGAFAFVQLQGSTTDAQLLVGGIFCLLIYVYLLVANYWRKLPPTNGERRQQQTVTVVSQYVD